MAVKKASLIFSLVVALSISMVSIADGDRSTDECLTIYSDAARMNEVIVSPRDWAVGHTASPSAKRWSAANGLLMESVAQPLIDCSDVAFQCLRSWTHTLAIPRSGVKERTSYQKDNVTFVVEDCLRIDGDDCSVAVISSRCEVVNADGTCALGKKQVRQIPKFENVDYFVYHQDFGITAFGSTDRLFETAEKRMMIASRFVLITKSGIFGPRTTCARN